MATKEIDIAKPFKFRGDSSDIGNARNFIDLCNGYLEINAHIYNNDKLKQQFALSYMQEGPAGSWALAFRQRQNAATNWGTYPDFEKDFKESFITQNEQTESTQKLLALTQRGQVAGYISEFRTLATRAGISEFTVLSQLFMKGLYPDIREKVVSFNPFPTNMTGLYKVATDTAGNQNTLRIFDYKRLSNPYQAWNKSFQANRPSWQNNRQNNNNRTFQFKRLTDEERGQHMKENKCFSCHKTGHRARFCPERKLAIRAIRNDNNYNSSIVAQNHQDRVTCIRQLMGNLSVNEFGQLMEQLAEEHQDPVENQDNQYFQ